MSLRVTRLIADLTNAINQHSPSQSSAPRMHLIRRFFGFLAAKPLSPADQGLVAEILAPALARAFFAQRFEDQRHAFDVLSRVSASDGLVHAALLHDIGKTESDLGAMARSLATLCNGIGLPTRGRWRSYLNHGAIGAEMLVNLEANDLAIAFTRNHPGQPPIGIDPIDWQLLEDADNA